MKRYEGAIGLTIAVWIVLALAPTAGATVSSVSPVTFMATASQQFSGTVATFQSPSNNDTYSVEVDWGDGSAATDQTIAPPKSSNGTYDAPGTHTYAREGDYKVTVTVQDTTDKTSPQSATSTAEVSDAPLSAQPAAISTTAGQQFSGPVATFTDPDTSGGTMAYSATINWGDGTSSPGAVTANQSGGFAVTGAHTWPCCGGGSFKVTVAIHDAGGASTSVTDTANVAPGKAPPPAAPPFSVTTTAPSTGQRVTFDSTPLDAVHGGAIDHRWDLNGDGIPERDTHFAEAVQIAYGQPGTYAVTLTTTYRDGTVASFHGTEAVSGGAMAGCGSYCHTSFPLHAPPASDASCQHTLHFGVVDAVGDCLRPAAGGTFEADGALRVNGLDFTPDNPSDHVVLDPAHGTISSGSARVELAAGELLLGNEPIDWTGLGASGRVTVPNVLGAGSLEGFPFVGSASLTLTYVTDSSPTGPGNHGITTIGGYVMLPDFIGGISVSVGVGIDNNDGLTLDQLHVSVDNARLKFLPIKMLQLDYDQSGARWSGALEVTVGTIDVGGGIGLRPADPAEPSGNLTLDHLSVVVDDLNQSITAGIFLQQINAGFTLGPPHDIFQGGVQFTEGPKIADTALIQLNGEFTVTTGDPVEFNLSAELDVLSFKVATAMVDYRTDGHLSFDAHVRVPYWDDGQPVPVAYIRADVDGFVDGPSGTWLAEGHAGACLGVCLDVDALASNIAVAGCAGFGFGHVGGAYTFSDRVLHLFGGLGGTCDLSAYRPSSSSAAAGTGARALRLPPGTRLASFVVQGQGAPPLVTFSGPHGLSVSTPTGAPGLKNAHFWLIRNAADDSTYLALTGPDLGGTWTISPQSGSAPVTGATYALARPPVKVSARVTGHGRRRVLRYRLRPQPGQQVVFYEVGAGGAQRIIGTAQRARGTLAFTPTEGPGGRRKIVARVLENRLPRASLNVASYLAPAPVRPARPRRLTLRRVGGTLVAAWAPARGASSYEVTFTTINHRRQLIELPASRRSVVFTIVRPVDAATVGVVGLDADLRPGPAATGTAPANRGFPAAKRRRRHH